MSERIGLIGAGAMGAAIGTRLLETGNSLKVFDLDTEKVAHLVSLGAVGAGTAAQASLDVDFVITSLKDLTSTVLLEALAQGVPVICPDHCGFADVVTGECGLKIPMEHGLCLKKIQDLCVKQIPKRESRASIIYIRKGPTTIKMGNTMKTDPVEPMWV